MRRGRSWGCEGVGWASWTWFLLSTDDWLLVVVYDDVERKWMVLVWSNIQSVELEPWW